jgi:hypothetical protein
MREAFLMGIRVCPLCNKAFYTQRNEGYTVCPHCEYTLYDKRREVRVNKSIDFTFRVKGVKRPAKTVDYSKDGIRIVYKGETLPVDTVVKININELTINRKAKVVWIKEINNISRKVKVVFIKGMSNLNATTGLRLL